MKKSDKEIIEILVAYDTTECVHSAARLAGCDPKTVRRYVAARDAGRPVIGPSRRSREIDAHVEKIEEWVDRSEGHISAARAYERLVRMGYAGSERTARRVVAEAKARWRAGDRRTYRPWIAEPGLWLQYDWGEGPVVPGPRGERRRTVLFSAWLAWSRFRVVIPCQDRGLPTLVCCLDTTLRALGGAPTYLLARPHTDGRIRYPDLVAVGAHYGLQVRVCAPYTGEPDGGGRAGEVRIAPADLVPVAAELRREYLSFGELRETCGKFCEWSNSRQGEWAGGRRADGGGEARYEGAGGTPYDRLAVERERLHALPTAPYTAGLGRTATVGAGGTVTYDRRSYAVPRALAGSRVWVRAERGELVVVADLAGLTEVARHRIPFRVYGEPGRPGPRRDRRAVATGGPWRPENRGDRRTAGTSGDR
ncbi:IS21 family transposase [Streptomyces sp. XD-27]|uniref:Mu transposase domain-containing protein n=1 Tax=Streptomyces sp. XD-27 TaxID=3062779 RepID=UPI0026F45FB2|nr:IS21 family transposase [Streptomyces sp. XD-27]WKX72265.1 IS21 family transposase [Streptomyces sp. XD-27]